MRELHIHFDSIEPGAEGLMTTEDGRTVARLKLWEPTEEDLSAATKNLSDAIDAQILAGILERPSP